MEKLKEGTVEIEVNMIKRKRMINILLLVLF